MLLDEPSNHLDIEATEWLENFLAESEQAMIVVSHDRYFLDRVTNRTLELFRGEVQAFTGNFSAYWRQKAERLEVQRRTFDKRRPRSPRRKNSSAAISPARRAPRRRTARRSSLGSSGSPRPARSLPAMGFPEVKASGEIVLRAEHLAKAFDRRCFRDLSFQIERGQRWGIFGPERLGQNDPAALV